MSRRSTIFVMSVKRAVHYVTTPIFYVNAKPHIGHLHSMVFADCLHRWNKFWLRPSRAVTGTDEHGTKVANAAAAAGVPPKLFVDRLSESFKQLANKANIDYSRFIRTTDLDHIARCQDFWQKLQENGYITKGKHSGWYCVSDETFYPETELIEIDSTLVSKESGNPVEWYEEENYFFKLSAFQQKLIDLYKSNPQFVLPKSRYQQLLNELESDELQDLSISRPADRCPWGIPVPQDPDHTMYVWFDALINYLTASDGAWPADHIIGKDIMRFHCIYWPAFLMAADIAPPNSVTIHNHWTMEGTKMSKSKQNVVDPVAAIDDFGLDTVRYFLMHDSSLDHDTPFSYPRLIERHNVNLVNKLGNLISRVCGPKFSIQNSLSAPVNQNVQKTVETAIQDCQSFASKSELNKILQKINEVAMYANQYFQDSEPWAKKPEDQREAIKTTAETCRILSLLLGPFCPEYSNLMLDRLGVSEHHRSSEFLAFNSDAYGENANRKGGVLQKIPEIEAPKA